MNLPDALARSCRGGLPAARSGFTLPELLVATTVFVLLVGGVVFAHLYGLSMFRITETKLNATDSARQTMARMADEIRACKDTWVGSIKNGKFAALLDGEKQEGTALLITNSASYILYFVNPADDTFRRTTSTPGTATVLAKSITNMSVFSAQDYGGALLTNRPQNRVIHVSLEFYQSKRHMQIADYFKLDTAVTRHASEVP